jgi:hypothetical protein
MDWMAVNDFFLFEADFIHKLFLLVMVQLDFLLQPCRGL